jgi:hypothetical protein
MATAPPARATYRLMVINGSGGGHYQEGWTFDRWKGETGPIPDIRSMHATLTMPPQDMRIEATYKQIPVWSASVANLSGREIYYYFPPHDYKGVILFFHGSGGDAREWSNQ